MTTKEFQLLYEYDRWANQRTLQAAAALTPEQFTRDLGGGFRSVRDTLVHIIGGEWGWFTYWREPSPSATVLADLWDRHDVLFTPDAFPDIASVQARWAEIGEEQAEFVKSMTSECLEGMLPFQTIQVELAQLMQHLANHSSYHRGQVALMMRQLGAEPAITDFHGFLLESRSGR